MFIAHMFIGQIVKKPFHIQHVYQPSCIHINIHTVHVHPHIYNFHFGNTQAQPPFLFRETCKFPKTIPRDLRFNASATSSSRRCRRNCWGKGRKKVLSFDLSRSKVTQKRGDKLIVMVEGGLLLAINGVIITQEMALWMDNWGHIILLMGVITPRYW